MRGWGGLLAVATLVAGCAAPPYAQDEDVTGLVQAYRQQSARAAQPEGPRGIRSLTVEPVADRPGEFLVTADLDRAPLRGVVERLLEDARVPHLITQPLLGRVTGRFDKHPLLRMLNEILAAHGYVADMRDGLLVISEGARSAEAPGPPAAPGAPPTASGAAPSAPGGEGVPAAITARGMQLRHLDIEVATKFLEGIFPLDPRTGARPIAWAVQPYTSTVFVSGPRPDVARALRLLDEMDRGPGHVMIEALVVELDTNELERFGTDLGNFMQSTVDRLGTAVGGTNTIPGFGAPAAAAPAALRFLYNGNANNRRQFDAVIDVLASQDKARIIARPYLASVSGRQAAIQIQRERTVAVVAGVSGQVTSSTETIPSGVILTVTPWVLEGDHVRLDVQVEHSLFLRPPENSGILVEKDANKAQTSMQVRSGQSVIIGGLALQETFSGNAGLPWLRNVPGLSLLTAKQTGNERKQDVLVFVTPYIWTPAVDPPIPQPDAFKFREEDELTTIEKWKRRWIKP
jgi:type II secretory pathway component GspD/PulD (secretin)